MSLFDSITPVNTALRQTLRASSVLTAFATLLLVAGPALGHSRWVVPTHTVLSGEEAQTVTFDVSVSNDIFHPDMPFGGPKMRRGPLQGAVPTITLPDGQKTTAELTHHGRKSVFDLELAQSGTHQIEVATDPILLTFWKTADGRGRAFGSKETAAEKIPEDATEIQTRWIHSRIVTWVTRNQPTETKPSGVGLELRGVHPNDLFTGEDLQFELLVDGKPAPAGVEIKLTLAGTRHRNDRASVEAETGETGAFQIRLDQAGFYLLEADFEIGDPTVEGVDQQSYSLFATLELHPE